MLHNAPSNNRPRPAGHSAFHLCAVLIALLLATPAFARDFVYVSVAGEKKIKVFELAEGKLTQTSDFELDGQPGASVVHPNGRFLFASVRSTGQIAAFNIDNKDCKLEGINLIDAGADPAYVSVDPSGRWLLSAYYRAGKVSVHRINFNGRLNTWPAYSVATDAKAHAAEVHRSNTALVPHTGPNAIYQFRLNEQTGQLKPSEPKLLRTPTGTGPRHVVFHPTQDLVYASNEQGSSVTRFVLNAEQGTLAAKETVSSLPAGFEQKNSCSHLVLNHDASLLFVANRGHDSIAAFRVEKETGKLTAAGHFPTEKTPRGFAIAPDGKHLIVAGQASGRLAVYSIGTGKDQPVLSASQVLEVGTRPWWVTIHSTN